MLLDNYQDLILQGLSCIFLAFDMVPLNFGYSFIMFLNSVFVVRPNDRTSAEQGLF